MQHMKIDFNRIAGPIKPLHGVNNSPIALYNPLPEFQAAGIPYVRLHDTAGAYGGSRYVDIPNVFPNFNADPDQPESYDFAFTDAYLKQLVASGAEPFFRLGVTIENNYRIRGYHNHPPADFTHWAKICAGIIRHYNEGWANGFHHHITYWEIWNEPENPPMWSGTREQYFELYRATAEMLKAEFPQIRIGGYASCGFYAVTREGCSEFYRSFLTWFDRFLDFVSVNRVPLDFFSWHLYTSDPEEIVKHALHVDRKLHEYGLTNVENIFDEWNFIDNSDPQPFVKLKEAPGAAFTAAAFCLMQNSPIDKAMYYDALPTRSYCGLYYFPSLELTPTYYAFKAFHELHQLGNQSGGDSGRLGDRLYGCAAHDAKNAALLLVNNDDLTREIALELSGPYRFDTALLLDRDHRLEATDTVFEPVHSLVKLPPFSVVLLKTGTEEAKEPEAKTATGRKKNLNGIDTGTSN